MNAFQPLLIVSAYMLGVIVGAHIMPALAGAVLLGVFAFLSCVLIIWGDRR